MKHFLIIFTVSSFFLMFSCSPDTAADKRNKINKAKEVISKKPMTKKYWSSLEKAASINDDQIKQLKDLEKKYIEKRKSIPGGSDKNEAIVKLSLEKEAEEKQILGKDTWAKKDAFDERLRRVKKQKNKKKE